jgi:glutathione synthase/RimK-type ligase-like ATP-grasp enzyme
MAITKLPESMIKQDAGKAMSIGYIYYKSSFDVTDKLIVKALQKKLNVVLLPLEEQMDLEEVKRKTKDCRVVINFSASELDIFESIELSKALEEIGKRVISPTHTFFYQEDKWMFYLKCIEHKLPTPRTYLIPKQARYDSQLIKSILKERQLVLKATFSDNALCVEKVSDYDDFIRKLRKVVRRNPISPIIAQEFIPNANRCYRATLIGHRLTQFVVKIGRSWKLTGSGKNEHYRTVRPSLDVRRMCERASRIFGMEYCGLDIIENGGRWYIIEANSCPGVNFITDQRPRLVAEIAEYAYRACRRMERRRAGR